MNSKNSMLKICLAGNGWGAHAALTSLESVFTKILIVTDDKELLARAKLKGFKVESSILNVDANIFICAGYVKILNSEFLKSKTVLNIHYSLLPKYRGLHSTVWAILNNESHLGLSVHIMNEFVDDGPIIHQYKFINSDQTSREAIEHCNDYIQKHLSKILTNFLQGKVNMKPQNRSKATWVCRRNLDDCIIDFNWTTQFIKLFFRALVDPYPLPRIKVGSLIVEVMSYELTEANYEMTIGRVVNIEDQMVWIKVKNGLLVIKKARDISNGNPIEINKIFKLGMRL